MTAWWTRLRRCGERGSVPIEVAIVAPALLMLLFLGLAAGRLVEAGNKVDAAAEDAAREASLSRSQATATSAASSAAKESLTGADMSCQQRHVDADTSALAAPVGEVAEVTVTVRCTVSWADLLLPAPGTKTVTGQFSSTVDAFRERK